MRSQAEGNHDLTQHASEKGSNTVDLPRLLVLLFMPGKGGTPFNEPSPLLPRDGASLRDDKPLVDLGANKYNKNVSDTPIQVCHFFLQFNSKRHMEILNNTHLKNLIPPTLGAVWFINQSESIKVLLHIKDICCYCTVVLCFLVSSESSFPISMYHVYQFSSRVYSRGMKFPQTRFQPALK